MNPAEDTSASEAEVISPQSVTTGAGSPQAGVGLGVDLDSILPTKEEVNEFVQQKKVQGRFYRRSALVFSLVLVSFVAVIGVATYATRHRNNLNGTTAGPGQAYGVQTLPLTTIGDQLKANMQPQSNTLTVNGSLNVNGSLVIEPASQPTDAVAGQLYYDSGLKQLAYYNGSGFVDLQTAPKNTGTTTSTSTAGVLSLNGLAGNITIADTTTNGGTITPDDASTTRKGVAQFNADNFTASNGAVNTVQNIGTGASPSFAQLTVSSGLLNGQTISSAANFTGSVTINGVANFNGGAAVTGTLTADTITPNGPMALGAASQSLMLQGNGSTTISATDGGNTVTLGFDTPTANVVYNLPTASAGTYDICTTIGNCGGGGGSLSGAGTADTLAMFTGSETIGNSIITQSGSTVSVAGTVTATSLQGNGSAVTNVNAVSLQGNTTTYFTNASNISSGTLADARLSGNVPLLNASDNFTGANLEHNGNEICDNSNNCSYLTGSAANGAYLELQASTPGTTQTGNYNISGTGTVGSLKATTVFQNGHQVCDVSGNCTVAGGGSGVTGSGTVNTLTMFTASGTIGNSIITQSGTTDTVGGTLSATNLQGNGSGITSLNASSIASGTLADARLSGNVPLLNANNNFTGANLEHNGSAVCDASNNCGYAAASGSGNYIQNTTTQQVGANFNISGTGQAATLEANTFDTATAGTLNIGTANATAITLGSVGVTTTDAGSLVVSGSVTANGIISQTSSLNTTGSITSITVTNTNTSSTQTLVGGISIHPIGTANSNSNANILEGIFFNNVTALANNNFYALNFGTGYNDLLRYNGTQLINGTGILQNGAIGATTNYSNLDEVGALSSGSITTGFGSISTNNSIATTATLQGNTVTAGTASVAGSLVVQDGSGHGVTVKSSATTSNFSLALPAAGASSGQCLQSGSGSTISATNLVFGSCSGSTTTLQQAYNNSAGTSPSIDMTSSNGAFTIQNDNTSPISGELFGVHDKTASGLGAGFFTVSSNGATAIQSSTTTGNALNVAANSLTTGSGLNLTSSSQNLSTGSLLNVSSTATLTNSSGSFGGNLVNVDRSLTANDASLSPTLDTSTTGFTHTSPSLTMSFTVNNSFSNEYLLVTVNEENSTGICTQPLGVTYNGASMSEIGTVVTGSSYACLYFFGLAAPTTGTHNIVVSGGTNYYIAATASDWYNVNQSNPVSNFSSNYTPSGSSTSLTGSSVGNEVMVDSFAVNTATSGLTPTTTQAGQTAITTFDAAPTVDTATGQSWEPAGASTTTMGWTGFATNSHIGQGMIGLNGIVESVTNSVASISNECAITAGSCNDSSSVLSLSQNYNQATGGVLNVQNNGTGAALQVEDGSSNIALSLSTANITADTTAAATATLTIGENSITGRSINAAGSVNASGADYAEYFPQADPGQLQSGDVVCLDASSKVEACNTGNDDTLIGAVSTNPGYVGNDIYKASDPGAAALVGLLGQIKVKVSTANGPIQVGDMLTYSATDGVAVKATSAGMALGSALASYTGSGTSEIEVYVHVGYYDPTAANLQPANTNYIQQGDAATFSALSVNGDATITNLNVTDSLTTATLTINGHIVSGGSTPAITANTAVCGGATVTIDGTDTAGLITFTTPANCSPNGKLATITFSKSFTRAPNVSLTPANADTANLHSYVDSASTSTTSFDISAAAGSSSNTTTTYKWYYQVIQ